MVLLTNHLRLAASTVAAVYRERWQVEQFFRALKQSLRIKTFVGTSVNAVLVQIWTALIAMLLLRWLQMRSSFGWSLLNLVALLRQQLFVYRDLLVWLDHPSSLRRSAAWPSSCCWSWDELDSTWTSSKGNVVPEGGKLSASSLVIATRPTAPAG
jgi:hypothetical protein